MESTNQPTATYYRDGDYICNHADMHIRMPMSPVLKKTLDPYADGLIEGKDFIVHAGAAMMPLPTYTRAELLNASKDSELQGHLLLVYGIRSLEVAAVVNAILNRADKNRS